MAAFFGIHVGNSSACIAIYKEDGRVEVVANEAGDRITPAVVQWTTNGCTVGKTAQLELFRNTLNTIIRNKQLINSNISREELNFLKNQVSYKINQADSELKYELLFDGKQYHVSPREVLGWIFKKLLSVAHSAVGGNKDINVVITVPLYYSQKSIHLVKEVAKVAGFNILQVIDAASASALGCNLELDPNESPYYCMIYRVGGVSIDATILLVQDGMFSIVESVHKYDLGGSLLTEKLFEYLVDEFKRQYRGAEISKRGKHKLMFAAENAKQVLSIQNVVQCSCESVGNGYDFTYSVSRARYENIVASLTSEIIKPIADVLTQANLSDDKIKKVITCGGAMKTPKLQDAVRKLLPHSEIINFSPDEVIAIGAAKQAGYLIGFDHHLPDTLNMDTPSLSTSLFIEVKQGDNPSINYPVFKNSLVPLKKKFEEVIINENVDVYLKNDENRDLGMVSLQNLEHTSKVTINLEISKDGKVVLTLINQLNKEKAHLKFNLNEIAKS